MCDYDDGERADVWDEKHPVARKVHTCDECRLPISAGTRYVRIDSLFDGRWNTYKVHEDCHDFVKWLAFDVCQQQTYHLGWETIRGRVREHMREDPRVLPRYRELLRARIREGVWPVRRTA